MLAMNSDLYFEETASWPRLLLDQPLGLLDLLVLLLGFDVLFGQQRGLALEILVRFPQLLLLDRSSSAWDWDCSSSFSVSVLASMVLRTRPMLSGELSRNAW